MGQPRTVKTVSRAGFTLMEVLVVVAIIVILAGTAVAVFGYLETSKRDIARAQIKILETAVSNFKLRHHTFPENLAILAQPMEGAPALIEEKDLYDPWNNPYQLDPSQLSPTGRPLIFSQGPNPGDASGRISNFDVSN
jgi:general secretion pathway protein G